MKTFFSDLIPKIQRYSQKLDNLTLLTNQHWAVIGDNDNSKSVFIFRDNNELLISSNGKVEKGRWEYLGNNTLLIDRKEESFLYKHGFFDANILALKVDGRDEYAFLVNENKSGGDLNSFAKVISFLQNKYMNNEVLAGIYLATGGRISEDTTMSLTYSCSKYQKIRMKDEISFWGSRTEHYHIIFEDGREGGVSFIVNKREAYFIYTRSYVKRKVTHYESVAHYYINIVKCIKALHYYLVTGKTSSDGYIISHSYSK